MVTTATDAVSLVGSLRRFRTEFDKAVTILETAAQIEQGHAERVAVASREAVEAASIAAREQTAALLAKAKEQATDIIAAATRQADSITSAATEDSRAVVDRLTRQAAELRRELEVLGVERDAANAALRALDERVSERRAALRA